MKRIIVPTGYMGSGSSAVTDLLSEYKDVSNDFKSFEYVFLHCPNGLFDLEDELLIGNNAIRSDYSIRAFENQMKNLYDKKFWWIGNYKKIIGPKFMDYTNEFVNNITEFKFNSYWYPHEEPNTKMIFKLLVRKPFKIICRNKLFNKKILRYNDGMKVSYINADTFYKYSKEYIYNVLNEACHGKENVVFDQLLLPFNLFRVDNYFNDNLKVICVERDPRDVFLVNKYVWSFKNAMIPIPTDVQQFCEFYKKMRESEKKVDSNKILRIRLEDLIYKYDETVDLIQKFVGFTDKDHIRPKTKFIPEISIKNTQLFYGNKAFENEVKIIEKNLKDYLYDFPYKLENKIENSVMFYD